MNLDEIRQFESELDRELDARPTLRLSGVDALVSCLKTLEVAYSLDSSPSSLRDGLSVLASRYVTSICVPSISNVEPNIEEVVQDMLFGCHYYLLREYLYYRYNKPDAIRWERKGKDITVTIADRTLIRQFFHVANRWFVESSKRFQTYDGSRRITELISEQGGFAPGEHTGELAELILYEVDLKLTAYYDLLDPRDDISLGAYSYRDFYQIYRQLLGTALMHRYVSQLEHIPSMVTFSREDLAQRWSKTTGCSPAICRAVLLDLVFDAAAVAERINAVHFSLFAASPDGIVMSPSHVLYHEGLVSILRVVAQRRPQHFLKNVSGPLGNALSRRVCEVFTAAGLTAHANVSLAHIDPTLPDIDVLAISEELTLGYVLYVAEVKNPLPPQWAKDQLRAVHADNIPKAITQLDRLLAFFGTKRGAVFLRERLPRRGLPHFGEEFVVLIKALVVTSDSVGMLMEGSQYPIIDYRTLENILAGADGDVVYINWALGQLDAMADQGTNIVKVSLKVGEWNVTFDGVTIERLAEFGKNRYKRDGRDLQLAEDFIAAGHHPHDVIVTLHDPDDGES